MAKLIRYKNNWRSLNSFYNNKLVILRSSSNIISCNNYYHHSTNKWQAYPSNMKSNPSMIFHRHFCEKKDLIQLMEFPKIIWPSLLNAVKNWIMANLIITPHYDRDFTLQEFVRGAKMAVVSVSNSLAEGKFDQLDGLVTHEALSEIQNNLSRMTVTQRHDLRINEEDIYFTFPYQIASGVIDSGAEPQVEKQFIEITMCFHVLRGFKELQENPPSQPTPMQMEHYRDRLQICNYRFIRFFTRKDGKTFSEDEWTVNILNHFKPGDV